MNQKIKDGAREKIAKHIFGIVLEENTFTGAKMIADMWEELPQRYKDEYLNEADQILSLSSETDEVCDECKGRGYPNENTRYTIQCFNCKGTGRKLWRIEIVEG